MGFRFRKSVKIMPGVRLNFSKSGVSTSVGGRGATVNFSKRGTRTTIGIPGTGLSYSSFTSSSASGGRRTSYQGSHNYTSLKTVNDYYDFVGFKDDKKPTDALKGWSLIILIVFILLAFVTFWWFALLAVLQFLIIGEIVKEKDRKAIFNAMCTAINVVIDELYSMANEDEKPLLSAIPPRAELEASIKNQPNVAYYQVGNIFRLHYFCKKYGVTIGHKLFNHQYFIGMSKEQLLDTKGEPQKRETEVTAKGEKETFIYGNSKQAADWFVLENSTVVKFVDK